MIKPCSRHKKASSIICLHIKPSCVDKSIGKIRYLKAIGTSSDEIEIELFYQSDKKWISNQVGMRDVFLLQQQEEEEKQVADHLLNHIENILLNGTQLILNQVFKLIGFNSIDDEILKHPAIVRLCQLSSKAGKVDYLQ